MLTCPAVMKDASKWRKTAIFGKFWLASFVWDVLRQRS